MVDVMDRQLESETIIQYVAETFVGVNIVVATEGLPAGDTLFVYDPDRNLEPIRQFPFATIVTKDYADLDNASNLDRPGVYRLNLGASPARFRSRFGAPSSIQPGQFDFTAHDTVTPHPVYATQSFVCVLNPSAETFERVQPLLAGSV